MLHWTSSCRPSLSPIYLKCLKRLLFPVVASMFFSAAPAISSMDGNITEWKYQLFSFQSQSLILYHNMLATLPHLFLQLRRCRLAMSQCIFPPCSKQFPNPNDPGYASPTLKLILEFPWKAVLGRWLCVILTYTIYGRSYIMSDAFHSSEQSSQIL